MIPAPTSDRLQLCNGHPRSVTAPPLRTSARRQQCCFLKLKTLVMLFSSQVKLYQEVKEHVHPEQIHSKSQLSSIVNSYYFRSIHRNRLTGNERRPGSVLLARERLLERLRGVSISGNRQNISSSSNTHQNDNNLFEEMSSEFTRNHHHHPGFALDAVNCLKLEVFIDDGNGDEYSMECTICLEGFDDGDEVIRLNCSHVDGFHTLMDFQVYN
ncbi:hypothetical protein L1887_22359 [Cichorium endivia]|nr:hypothetical protein L1887_22359 [Cichorium endivia]